MYEVNNNSTKCHMKNGIYVLYIFTDSSISCIKSKLQSTYVFDLVFCARFVQHVLSHCDFFPLFSGRLFFIDPFTLYRSWLDITTMADTHSIVRDAWIDGLSDNERRTEGRIGRNWIEIEARRKMVIWWKRKGRKAKLAARFLFFTREKRQMNKKAKMFERG